MNIRGQLIPVKTGMLKQAELRFYRDNPRVYSVVHGNGGQPTQDEIESALRKLDHVKDLVHDIKSHGGLIEPLLVRDDSYDVLEGNSRLAAYRILADKDPVTWGKVKCTVLPASIDPSLVSALLSQLHLKGKKEWPPFEQAGHVYRRFDRDKLSHKELSVETGLPTSKIKTLVAAYRLMVERGDDEPSRWSYYLELVKSRKIAKAREAHADFDDVVLEKIGTEIPNAQALRDRLPVICDNSRVLKKFLTAKLTFDEAHEQAVAGGSADALLARVTKFRSWIAQNDNQDALVNSHKQILDKVKFEVNRLQKILSSLEKKFPS